MQNSQKETSGRRSAFCATAKAQPHPMIGPLKLLKEKHPLDDHQETLQDLQDPASVVAWQTTTSEVLQAIRSFSAGSGGGPDGLRPDHLKDLVGFGGPIQPLVEAIIEFVNLLLRGGCPKDIRPILFGGNLIALNKESEGLRPIAIGYVWRRLTAKCANKHAITKLSAYFAPLQLGIGIPGGCGRHETLRVTARCW